MDILIRGMEMPLNCATCYRDGTHYHVHMLAGCPFLRESIHSHDFRKERHPNCPLTEIPPHGRLIDADVMKTKIEGNDPIIPTLLEWIDQQHTIIEAEEGE